MEALPIFLDKLVASYLSIIISVTFVLIFGEIIPQAIFTSDPILTGYKYYFLVKTFEFILFLICYPISYLLDCSCKSNDNNNNNIYYSGNPFLPSILDKNHFKIIIIIHIFVMVHVMMQEIQLQPHKLHLFNY